MDFLFTYGGFSKFDLVSKLVCFGANEVTTFWGSKTSVIVQLKEKHMPFMLGVHYVTHQTNLGSKLSHELKA
jgi:hypothetical protein